MTKLADLKKRLAASPVFNAAYREAEAEFVVIEALILARDDTKLSRAELAARQS
jgi:hypothetical protein